MNVNIFLVILSLGTFALVIFILIKLRDKDTLDKNKSNNYTVAHLILRLIHQEIR